MAQISSSDKMGLAKYLESSAVSLATLNTVLPIVEDDGLKRIIEASISTTETHVKGIQEFCKTHGLS